MLCSTKDCHRMINLMIFIRRTFTMSSEISFFAQAHETLCLSVKSASSTSFGRILALKAACSYRDIKINSDSIFRNLIIRLRSSNISPINTCITSTILEHQPQRLSCSWRVRAARTATHSERAPRHVPAKVATTVTGRITAFRKTLTEDWLWLNDHVILTAVEKEVLILRGKLEACAGVQTERPCGAIILSILTVPHEWISDQNVRISIANIVNGVSARRGSDFELSGVRTRQNVSVVGASTAIVNAKRVFNRNVTTRSSACGGLRPCESEK